MLDDSDSGDDSDRLSIVSAEEVAPRAHTTRDSTKEAAASPRLPNGGECGRQKLAAAAATAHQVAAREEAERFTREVGCGDLAALGTNEVAASAWKKFYDGFHTGASGGTLELEEAATTRSGGDAKIRIRHVKLSPGARSDFERIQEAMVVATRKSDRRLVRSYEESAPSLKLKYPSYPAWSIEELEYFLPRDVYEKEIQRHVDLFTSKLSAPKQKPPNADGEAEADSKTPAGPPPSTRRPSASESASASSPSRSRPRKSKSPAAAASASEASSPGCARRSAEVAGRVRKSPRLLAAASAASPPPPVTLASPTSMASPSKKVASASASPSPSLATPLPAAAFGVVLTEDGPVRRSPRLLAAEAAAAIAAATTATSTTGTTSGRSRQKLKQQDPKTDTEKSQTITRPQNSSNISEASSAAVSHTPVASASAFVNKFSKYPPDEPAAAPSASAPNLRPPSATSTSSSTPPSTRATTASSSTRATTTSSSSQTSASSSTPPSSRATSTSSSTRATTTSSSIETSTSSSTPTSTSSPTPRPPPTTRSPVRIVIHGSKSSPSPGAGAGRTSKKRKSMLPSTNVTPDVRATAAADSDPLSRWREGDTRRLDLAQLLLPLALPKIDFSENLPKLFRIRFDGDPLPVLKPNGRVECLVQPELPAYLEHKRAREAKRRRLLDAFESQQKERAPIAAQYVKSTPKRGRSAPVDVDDVWLPFSKMPKSHLAKLVKAKAAAQASRRHEPPNSLHPSTSARTRSKEALQKKAPVARGSSATRTAIGGSKPEVAVAVATSNSSRQFGSIGAGTRGGGSIGAGARGGSSVGAGTHGGGSFGAGTRGDGSQSQRGSQMRPIWAAARDAASKVAAHRQQQQQGGATPPASDGKSAKKVSRSRGKPELLNSGTLMKPTGVCRHYQNGVCPKGSECKFVHCDKTRNWQNSTVCRFFMAGKCTEGDNCIYSHDLKLIPCAAYNRARFYGDAPCLATADSECPFSHAPISESDYIKSQENPADRRANANRARFDVANARRRRQGAAPAAAAASVFKDRQPPGRRKAPISHATQFPRTRGVPSLAHSASSSSIAETETAEPETATSKSALRLATSPTESQSALSSPLQRQVSLPSKPVRSHRPLASGSRQPLTTTSSTGSYQPLATSTHQAGPTSSRQWIAEGSRHSGAMGSRLLEPAGSHRHFSSSTRAVDKLSATENLEQNVGDVEMRTKDEDTAALEQLLGDSDDSEDELMIVE